MTVVLLAVMGFALGSLPFSYWIGQIVLRADICSVGDGNPGAANAWRAGSWRTGLPAILLDWGKGALPAALAHFRYGISDWGLVPVALAPVLGHAFSPWLGGKGGKAVATTFGIWTGLTLWEGPTVLGLAVALLRHFQAIDGWTVMMGMGVLLAYLALRGLNLPLLVTWLGNLAVLAYKHREELKRGPRRRVRVGGQL